jgi:predicted metalloendopeptidase
MKAIKRKINHHNLEYYFMEDHKDLPAEYLASCEKFFKSIAGDAAARKTKTAQELFKRIKKLQATSSKQQA